MKNAKTALYAVTGRPVAHSRSPQMHNAAFEALGMDAAYVRLAAAGAADALAAAGSMGLSGMNVTAPFKEDMAGLVDRMDEEAESIGAVNTIVFGDGKAKGRNTDIYGVRTALEENCVPLKGVNAVVLGAGGAAKAAGMALLSAGAQVTIANRTVDKARQLAKKLGCAHCQLAESELAGPMASASVVVSSLDTSERVVPQSLLRRSMTIFEAKYDVKTALRADAERTGCRIIDGREWLLYQGAKAFTAFTGKDAPVEQMKKALYGAEPAGRRHRDNIALIGFMGSGKTSVGGEIAGRAGCTMLDTDAEIEKAAGRRIAGIFTSEGEGRFRELEKAQVAKVAGLHGSVVACGGGVVTVPENVRVIRESCRSVWLWADVKTMLGRLKGDGARPLLGAPGAGREAAAMRIMDGRLKQYAAAADIVVDTRGKTPAGVAELIMDEVGETLRN